MTMELFAAGYLLYFLIPIWIVAGFADWLCHRTSQIESTTGTRESILHLAMLAEGGLALLCGLFLEINAAVIAVLLVAWLIHEFTGFADLQIATSERAITPTEQRIHDYLAVLPLAALSLVLVLHWQQAVALLGFGTDAADFSLRLKDQPLPLWYLIALPGAVILLNIIPYLEETYRCAAYRERNLHRSMSAP